jgi:hypothetical protein
MDFSSEEKGLLAPGMAIWYSGESLLDLMRRDKGIASRIRYRTLKVAMMDIWYLIVMNFGGCSCKMTMTETRRPLR